VQRSWPGQHTMGLPLRAQLLMPEKVGPAQGGMGAPGGGGGVGVPWGGKGGAGAMTTGSRAYQPAQLVWQLSSGGGPVT